MNLFLRAKHWQIFIFTVGLPFVFYVIMIANLFSNIIEKRDPTILFSYFKFFPLMMLLCMGTLFGWMWSVAIGLQKMVPPGIKMKVTKFKIFFFIPVIYLALIALVLGYVFSGNFSPASGNIPGPAFFYIFPIIIPLHLFSIFCIFYSIYFVAKTIKTVELQRVANFGDFVGEFFMVWFHMIGVWILQPKINKLVEQYDNSLLPPPEID
jgi:hypothetical protein